MTYEMVVVFDRLSNCDDLNVMETVEQWKENGLDDNIHIVFELVLTHEIYI